MFCDSLNWVAFQKALAVVLEPERGECKLISSTDEDAMPLNMSMIPRPQEPHCGPRRVPLHSGWDGMLFRPERGYAGSLPFSNYSLENA